MAKQQTTVGVRTKTKIKRKGVHAKTKTSKVKGSKLYKKSYQGQG